MQSPFEVHRIVNKFLTSNSYKISKSNSEEIWIIDPGELDDLLITLTDDKFVKGVFVSHAHYDHIYGLNAVSERYPECKIYVSEYGKEGLYSEKINLSFYHESPIVFRGKNIYVLGENDKVELYEGCFMEVYETPGHNPGCLTYKFKNYLFTGDSFIPNVDVVTKLKGGNKEESKKSVEKIIKLINDDTVVCAGHGEMFLGKELKNSER